MRCRNCHTQLMDTDAVCPSCRASRTSATAAAPGEFTKPPGGYTRLHWWGGGVGGARPATLTPGGRFGGQKMFARGAPATRGSSPVKRMFGLLLLLGGLLFLVLAAVLFYNTWQ